MRLRVPGVRIPSSPQLSKKSFFLLFNAKLFYFCILHSGYSVARLSRLLWEQEVAGSNPATPTFFSFIFLIYFLYYCIMKNIIYIVVVTMLISCSTYRTFAPEFQGASRSSLNLENPLIISFKYSRSNKWQDDDIVNNLESTIKDT